MIIHFSSFKWWLYYFFFSSLASSSPAASLILSFPFPSGHFFFVAFPSSRIHPFSINLHSLSPQSVIWPLLPLYANIMECLSTLVSFSFFSLRLTFFSSFLSRRLSLFPTHPFSFSDRTGVSPAVLSSSALDGNRWRRFGGTFAVMPGVAVTDVTAVLGVHNNERGLDLPLRPMNPYSI